MTSAGPISAWRQAPPNVPDHTSGHQRESPRTPPWRWTEPEPASCDCDCDCDASCPHARGHTHVGAVSSAREWEATVPSRTGSCGAGRGARVCGAAAPGPGRRARSSARAAPAPWFIYTSLPNPTAPSPPLRPLLSSPSPPPRRELAAPSPHLLAADRRYSGNGPLHSFTLCLSVESPPFLRTAGPARARYGALRSARHCSLGPIRSRISAFQPRIRPDLAGMGARVSLACCRSACLGA
jgi:hypothetical protein